VLQVHARRIGPFPERVRDVGVVLDLAPDDIDVMRFVLESEVTRVHAETEQRINTEHEDMLSGVLRFANGVVGVLDVNWLTPTKIRELSVLGERGMFVVDYGARADVLRTPTPPRQAHSPRTGPRITEGRRRRRPPHRDQREPPASTQAFARAVRGHPARRLARTRSPRSK
jgi:predicted dehydrogenase